MKNKIFLVTLSPKTHRTSEENLGIEYLKASLCKNGYDVEIIDGWLCEFDVEDVFKKIIVDKDKTIFVGISSYMSNTKPTIDLIDKLKKYDSEIKIACGGFGPTFYPKDYLLNGSDYVMLGEGEEVIVELADCIKRNEIPRDVKNVGYKSKNDIIINEMRNLNDDLDSIPFPSRDLMDVVMNHKSTVNMLSSRGCSGNCEFCSVISFFRLAKGKVWRTRSIKNIVDEIEELYKNGVIYIKMVDDSFVDGIRDEKWCRDFADEIEKRNIKVRLRGQIRADKITDSILYNLKRAGFFSFACGIENGSETALARMNKKATLEDNKKALELFKKYGYLVQMGYILFDKETTYNELLDNYNFLSIYDYTVTKGIFSEMFSAEGTKLNTKLRKNKQIKESDFINNNNKYDINNDIVKKIYEALKIWHKSHSYIYDMTIDPLTAPKAIDISYLEEFYKYAMLLKKQDLELFRDLLLIAKNNSDIISFVNEKITNTRSYYENINKEVQKIYTKCKLKYNANENPFI